MTDLKQLAQNLRNYNAWRRGDGKNANIEMPHPIDLGTWIDSAIAVVEAHAKSNVLARQVERLAAERDALAAELKAMREQDPVSPDLLESARAVVARWDAPTWKDFPATAEYIGRLRAAIAQADLDGALTAEEWVVKNVSGSPGLVRAMVIRAEVAESAIETPAKISPCAGHAVQQDADEAKICATCRFLTKNGGCQSKGTSYNCVDYCQWEANEAGGA